MTLAEYAAAVAAERKALAKLQRELKAHGSPKSRLAEAGVAWGEWRRLAEAIDAEQGTAAPVTQRVK